MERREFAKILAGGALLGNVSLTGCIGSGNYTSWLYNPDEVAEVGDFNYEVLHIRPPNVPDEELVWTDGSTEGVQKVVVIGPNAFSGGGLSDSIAVIVQYSPDSSFSNEIEQESQGRDPRSTYQGYDIYEEPAEVLALNKEEGTALIATNIDVIEAVVDTSNGETQSYPQVSDSFSLATQTLSGGDYQVISENPAFQGTQFSDAQVVGFSADFDNNLSGMSLRYSYIFSSESTASRVSDEMGTNEDLFEGITLIDNISSIEVDNVAQNGRAVLVSGSATYNQPGTNSAEDQQDNTGLTEDRTLQGRITPNSSQDPVRNGLAEPHTLRGTSDERVEILMESEDFDTYLVLTDSSGAAIARDDDGGSNTNSRLTTTLPSMEEYTIWAGSFSGDATGSYTLSISR